MMKKKLMKELFVLIVLGAVVGALFLAAQGCRTTTIGSSRTKATAKISCEGLAEALALIPPEDRAAAATDIMQLLTGSSLIYITNDSDIRDSDLAIVQSKAVPFDIARGAKTAVMPGASIEGDAVKPLPISPLHVPETTLGTTLESVPAPK